MKMTLEQFNALGSWIMNEAAYMVAGTDYAEREAIKAREKAREQLVDPSLDTVVKPDEAEGPSK